MSEIDELRVSSPKYLVRHYTLSFSSAYLNDLKAKDWCLSPEQSIALHIENLTVPTQLLIRSVKARNNITKRLQN